MYFQQYNIPSGITSTVEQQWIIVRSHNPGHTFCTTMTAIIHFFQDTIWYAYHIIRLLIFFTSDEKLHYLQGCQNCVSCRHLMLNDVKKCHKTSNHVKNAMCSIFYHFFHNNNFIKMPNNPYFLYFPTSNSDQLHLISNDVNF